MRLLLDEDVPIQLLEPLRHLLGHGHQVEHVQGVGWKRKQDRFVLADAAQRGYDALITNDARQLDDPIATAAIRVSKLHHIRYPHDTRPGRDGREGLALAMASVLAAIRGVVRELDEADGQRLVEISGVQRGRRHTTIDPRRDPPRYWGRRGADSGPRRG